MLIPSDNLKVFSIQEDFDVKELFIAYSTFLSTVINA